MNLEKILSISGKPGLYALKVQTRSGFLAESLVDGKKISVGLKINVSLLSEISIYTYNEEKPLTEVMRSIAIKEDNGPAISHKEENATLIAYFKEILPEYDSERVYPSDIKKVLSWYNLLQSKGLVSKEEPIIDPSENEQAKQNAEEVLEKVEEEVVAEKVKAPAKKAKAKKE
ncbi:DUF5606 family protein [Flavobacterium soyangense]|uniref:DUF5606 domain-containing protein n=1 Tax=Flavobacterium soyangense TaxID=2023265 RepID=A0A930XW10_9FLAO|nr:DUF5606 domain-containing protein [Flavobacterium soyangense]MBF2708886.1 DUF5606 domain-containing protein [Flavobacterium soyangense]